MRIERLDTVAVIIDIQDRLLPHMSEKNEVLKNTQKLVQGLSALGIEILVTQQYTKGLGSTVEPITEVMPAFAPIEKSTFSCCDEAVFSRMLKNTGKHFVLVTGIEAHVCVLQTVLDLINSGYQPVVVADCVSSRKESDKAVALNRMFQHGAIISTYESVLFELTRSSRAPEFKAISTIVK